MIGNWVNMALAGIGNAVPVYQISNLAAMVGVKSYKIKRITILDVGAGGTLVHFGTGAAGAVVDAIPSIRTVNNQNVVMEYDDDNGPELAVDLMSYPDAATVTVQVEVDEIG